MRSFEENRRWHQQTGTHRWAFFCSDGEVPRNRLSLVRRSCFAIRNDENKEAPYYKTAKRQLSDTLYCELLANPASLWLAYIWIGKSLVLQRDRWPKIWKALTDEFPIVRDQSPPQRKLCENTNKYKFNCHQLRILPRKREMWKRAKNTSLLWQLDVALTSTSHLPLFNKRIRQLFLDQFMFWYIKLINSTKSAKELRCFLTQIDQLLP